MRHIQPDSHIPFLHTGLMQLLPKGSFSWRFRRSIGAELDAMLESDEDWERGNFSASFPAQSLFLWVSNGEGLALEWLASDDGIYFDDHGELLPSTIELSLTGSEQLAAFGLWLIEEDMECCGPSTDHDFDDQGYNPQGWTKYEVINHKTECLLNAYQALSYAERLNRGTQLSVQENEKAIQFDFSAIGKDGAEKRHAPMNALRVWAIGLYKAGEWPSANQAAHDLKDTVMEYGRTINATLQASNAQRTIADWFRRSV